MHADGGKLGEGRGIPGNGSSVRRWTAGQAQSGCRVSRARENDFPQTQRAEKSTRTVNDAPFNRTVCVPVTIFVVFPPSIIL